MNINVYSKNEQDLLSSFLIFSIETYNAYAKCVGTLTDGHYVLHFDQNEMVI